MTSREYLVYLLQDLYAFHREVLALLDGLHHGAADDRARLALQTQRDGVRGEQESTERALSLLGARYTLEHQVLGSGLREASERFRHQQAPARAQLDIHALLTALTAAGIARSKYQGAVELARAVGEQDIVRLLEELDMREVVGQADMAALLPQLIQENYTGEIRRAA